MAPKLRYDVKVSGADWTGWKENGNTAGNLTDGIVAVKFDLQDLPPDMHINYAVNGKELNVWTGIKADGQPAGFELLNLQIDKLYVDLANASNWVVIFRVNIQSFGWTGWAISGNANSTDGIGLDGSSILGVQAQLVKTNG